MEPISSPSANIGRHGLQGKQHLYEHAWRVPFLARGPTIKPGTRARGNIYLMDVLGTLCDLAGIRAPATNEGRSFRPVLEGRRDAVRDVVYGVFCGGTKPGMRAVKQGDWKLVKFDVLEGAVRRAQRVHPAVVEFLAQTTGTDQRHRAAIRLAARGLWKFFRQRVVPKCRGGCG